MRRLYRILVEAGNDQSVTRAVRDRKIYEDYRNFGYAMKYIADFLGVHLCDCEPGSETGGDKDVGMQDLTLMIY